MSEANTQLSGRELDKAIALLLYPIVSKSGDMWRNDEKRIGGIVSQFHADANALIAVCAEHGLCLKVFPDGGAVITKPRQIGLADNRMWLDDDDPRWESWDGATPQESAARALLLALEARA